MHLKVFIHQDGPEYWSEVAELPGCFASGRTPGELPEALAEATGLYIWDEPAEVEPGELTAGPGEIEVRAPEAALGVADGRPGAPPSLVLG